MPIPCTQFQETYQGHPDEQMLATLNRYAAELTEQPVRLDAVKPPKTDPAYALVRICCIQPASFGNCAAKPQ